MTSDSSLKNKQIAKNTFYLYIRMILLIVVNFYTTRVVLQSLGVEDFGLYNVVAGFVSMIAFLNHSMTNSIQRFYNFELGKGSAGNIKEYFETALLTQSLVVLFILIFTESIGLWFLNNKMVIPDDRIISANIVYQFSLLILIITTLEVPFNAIIIAKEKMNFYAIMSLIEAVAQLFIAYAISITSSYRLEIYAFLLFSISGIKLACNIVYSRHLIDGLRIRIKLYKSKLREVLSFSGWNLFGSASGVIKSQGINVLMNMFFGVAINAARGIAYQVLSCILKFVGNFQIAINPQIVQSYAMNDFDRYKSLTMSSAKISFTLMWFLTLPILFCSAPLLNLWLGDSVPEYSSLFLKIILLTGLIDSLGAAISVPIYATGKIRNYQIIVSSIIISIIPISYIVYETGGTPASGMWISLGLSFVAQIARVTIWSRLNKISPMEYIKKILCPAIIIMGISFLISYRINTFCLSIENYGLIYILVTTLYTVIINAILIYYIMLNASEKEFIKGCIMKVLKRK